MIAIILVGLRGALGHNYEVLKPLTLISVATIGVVTDFAGVSQQQPQPQMCPQDSLPVGTQHMPIIPYPQMHSFSKFRPPTNILY